MNTFAHKKTSIQEMKVSVRHPLVLELTCTLGCREFYCRLLENPITDKINYQALSYQTKEIFLLKK